MSAGRGLEARTQISYNGVSERDASVTGETERMPGDGQENDRGNHWAAIQTGRSVKDAEVGGQGSGAVPLRASLILAGLCFLWGGNLVAIKISNQGIPPLLAAAMRSVVASFLLWGYARLRGEEVFLRREALHKQGADVAMSQ